jgi:hypothetical protein
MVAWLANLHLLFRNKYPGQDMGVKSRHMISTGEFHDNHP